MKTSYHHDTQWGNAEAMTRALARIKVVFDDPSGGLPSHSISKVLRRYRQAERFRSFLEFKYACFGLVQQVDGWSLLNDARLFDTLLEGMEPLRSEPRRFRKCYQGLLMGYFAYPLLAADLPAQGRENFNRLRDCLKAWLEPATQQDPRRSLPTPTWLTTLLEHNNLLQTNPCESYVQRLLKGKYGHLRKIFQALGIQRESWVWEETVWAAVQRVCQYKDKSFKQSIDLIMGVLEKTDEIIIAERLAVRCIAALLVRYEQCRTKPEKANLCDAALLHIGNPWRHRVAWDADVTTVSGAPNNDARKMVTRWLDRRGMCRFSDNGDGTITDEQTGMIWLKKIQGLEREEWVSAMEQVTTLKHGQYGLRDYSKRGDWRLPSKDEMADMLDGLFPSALAYLLGLGREAPDVTTYYWSSTMKTKSSSHYWAMNLGKEVGLGYFDQLSSFFVWPVRKIKH